MLTWFTDKEPEKVKLSLVTGFPDHTSVALQQLPNIKTVTIDDLLVKPRVLTAGLGLG